MFNYAEAYSELKDIFSSHMTNAEDRRKYCPPKLVDILGVNSNGVVTAYRYHMAAHTADGDSFLKRIERDDNTGTVTEHVYYEGLDLKNKGITPVRCGLMNCYVIELFCEEKPKKIGYIGNGRVNLANCKAITEIYGEHSIVIRGSKNDRGKNKSLFEKYGEVQVDDTEGLELLNQCDVVISCTSETDKEDVIQHGLEDVPLIISLDSGFLLGEEFRRNRVCFTDHEEQLASHYEDEFPYDEEIYEHINLPTEPVKCDKAWVCLYGVAIADLVITRHYLKGGGWSE